MNKTIVSTSTKDTQENHRRDFRHCPDCDHSMNDNEWDKAATTLVLNPSIYRSDSITVLSECAKCFTLSWVHHRMDSFSWNSEWSEEWKEAVKKHAAMFKLDALREWGKGLCWNCKYLESGKIDFHAWRYCIIGSGPPVLKCPKFEKIT